jgi:hypothetical protein
MAYEIPINTSSLDAVIAKFKEAAAAVDTLNGSITSGERAMRGMARASDAMPGGSGSGSGGGGGFGRGRGPNNRVYDIARGAEQRYEIAQRRLDQARATGNKTLIADAQANLIRQERARARQRELVEGSATHGNAVWEAFMSSRIGPGGKLYPLVNRLRAAGFGSQEQLQAHFANQGMAPAAAAKAAQTAAASKVSNTSGALQNLGLSAATAEKIAPGIAGAASAVARLASAAMPLLIPGAIALAGAVGVGVAAENTSQMYRETGNLYYRSGSTPRGVGKLKGLGEFFGKDAGAASDALAGALHNGSYGAAVLNSRGVVDMGSFTRDRGANYIRAINELVKMKESDAIRVARDTGLQDELWIRDLSQRSRDRLMNTYEDMGSDEERHAEAEYTANKIRLGAKGNKLARMIGNPLVNGANKAMEGMELIAAVTGKLIDSAIHHTNPFDPGKGEKSKPEKSAIEENTDAINEHTRTLKDGREQIGGGSRSMGAVPAGWKLMTMDTALKSQAMALGAFGV